MQAVIFDFMRKQLKNWGKLYKNNNLVAHLTIF